MVTYGVLTCACIIAFWLGGLMVCLLDVNRRGKK